jgi:hypothetical protein
LEEKPDGKMAAAGDFAGKRKGEGTGDRAMKHEGHEEHEGRVG